MLRFVCSPLITACHCFALSSLQSVRLWWGSAVWWRSPSPSPWRRYWSVCASLSTSLWSSSLRTSYSMNQWRIGLCVTASSPFTPKVTSLVWCRTSLTFLNLPFELFLIISFYTVSIRYRQCYKVVYVSSDSPMRCYFISSSIKLNLKRWIRHESDQTPHPTPIVHITFRLSV